MNEFSDIKNVLISRTDRLGDVILTLPLIHLSKKIFPNAKIYFLIKKYVRDLLTNYEDIEEIFIEEDFPGIEGKKELFKEKKIDLFMNVKPEFEIAFAAFLAGVRIRIGTGYRWFSFLYNKKIYEHRKHCEQHEYEYNINLLKPFMPAPEYEKKFKFRYSKMETDNLQNKLSLEGLNLYEKFIIIHPGSGNSSKDVSAETLNKFSENFLDAFKEYKIILTGIGEEKKFGEYFKISGRLISLIGKLSLKELLILIDNSSLFLSNSTGPVHIAGALNKNIIAFYPNLKPNNAARWKPLSKNAVILSPADGTDNMSKISADLILDETKKILC